MVRTDSLAVKQHYDGLFGISHDILAAFLGLGLVVGDIGEIAGKKLASEIRQFSRKHKSKRQHRKTESRQFLFLTHKAPDSRTPHCSSLALHC